MAVSGKKTKTRLDFANSINTAVPPINEEKASEVPTPVAETDIEPVKTEEKVAPEAETKEQSDVAEVMNPPVQEVENEAEKAEVKPEPEKPKKKTAAKKTTTKKPSTKEEEKNEDDEDDIDTMLFSMKQSKGFQKSVYLEDDVYQYIQNKCEKTGAKFSNVLNILVRSAINQNKK